MASRLIERSALEAASSGQINYLTVRPAISRPEAFDVEFGGWRGPVLDSGETMRDARDDLALPTLDSDFPAVLDLASLDGANGFRLDGVNAYDRTGAQVASAGDVNGDGFDDVMVTGSGRESYVLFGRAGGFPAGISLADLDGSNGFRIEGEVFSISSAGDHNGDGFDDILIGSSGGDPDGEYDAGITFVVFGKAGGFSASFSLESVDGGNGFRIDGIDANDLSGRSVASAGDVNGDGFDDIIIGAPDADPNGQSSVGESYVVFGRDGSFTAEFDLAALDGGNGFRISGGDAQEGSLYPVASAGDINGDGIDDILIGNYTADPDGSNFLAGETYVIFGRSTGFSPTFDLDTLDGSNGFRLNGVRSPDFSGYSAASAGDVNGDGFDDVVIGAFRASPNGVGQAGASYVVFGRAGGFSPSIELDELDGSNGFRLDGFDNNDRSGNSVSSAGDVNGDGFDDVIIGARNGGDAAQGQSYVVFGKAQPFSATLDLSTLDGANGFRLEGIDDGDQGGGSVASAGDVNGDGFDDIIVGALGADPDGNESAGESYVVFGRAPSEAVERMGSVADQLIRGGAFDDTLIGKGGGDTLAGGAGRDRLIGGGGDDHFLLDGRAREDADKIGVFAQGADLVALDGDVFGLSRVRASQLVVGNAALDANDRLIYKAHVGKLYFDPDGTGAAEQVLIGRFFDPPPDLGAADFIVI